VSPPPRSSPDYFALLTAPQPRAAVCDAERELDRQPRPRRGAADRCRERRDSGPGRGLQLAGPGTIGFPFPEVRAVPVLTSVDCVPTKTGELGFFFLPFCGVRSGPHVAGIAALLIERAPTLSTEQLRGVLTGTAVDPARPASTSPTGSAAPTLPGALLRVLQSSRPSRPLAQPPQRRARRLPRAGLFNRTRNGDGAGLLLRRSRPARPLDHPGMSGRRCAAVLRGRLPRTVVLCYLTASRRASRPSSPA
jgi:hypothetical protein